MTYKLNVQNGQVEYLTIVGGTLVRHATTEDRAQWAVENKRVTYECIEGHPDFMIHAGDFYFASIEVKAKPRKRRTKDIVCE